jgi:hypothetical protein
MKLRRLQLNERRFDGYPLTFELSVSSTDESLGRGSSSFFLVLFFLPAAAAEGESSAIPMAFLMSSSNVAREGMYVLLVTKSAGVSRGPSNQHKAKNKKKVIPYPPPKFLFFPHPCD